MLKQEFIDLTGLAHTVQRHIERCEPYFAGPFTGEALGAILDEPSLAAAPGTVEHNGEALTVWEVAILSERLPHLLMRIEAGFNVRRHDYLQG